MSAARPSFTLPRPSRRNFLRGAAGVTLALPFLEGMPERSAWAAGNDPVFSLFICAVGGVVPAAFFPASPGPITAESLAGKATAELAAHARNLLFVSGIRRPSSSGDSHVEGLCEALTGSPDLKPNAQVALAMGPSADTFIAAKVHPGLAPLVLYSGQRKNGWSTWNLSFTESGELAPAIWNPYTLYQELIGITPGGGTTPAVDHAAKLLLESRKSIHDLVREDLDTLIKSPRLSAADRDRLQLHFDSVRDVEVAMGGMGNTAVERCSSEGLAIDQLQAMENFVYDKYESTETVGKLHMSLVALAFACNYRRSASLQWGDPADYTVYRVPSNAREWRFNFIQHRVQSDSLTGTDPLAAQAHAEIDALRMRSFAAGLDHFEARGLRDQCQVLWTNSFSDGALHSFVNVPHIIWGSAGGYLKQGQHVNAGDVGNNRLLNTLISAAIQDTGTTVEDFGQGPGGQLDIMRA